MECENDCPQANDGVCDDGGSGGQHSQCMFGSDCLDCGSRSMGEVLFIGDSDIEYWSKAAVSTWIAFPNSNNVGVAGFTCAQVLSELDAHLARYAPSTAVLVCGENDLISTSASTAFSRFVQVVERIIASGARVVFLSTKPEPSTDSLHAKYRDYDQADQNGEYAKVFEEEYIDLKHEVLSELPLENEGYRKYLEAIDQTKTHNGYFVIDKKGQMVDPKAKSRGEDAGLSDDISAYDLILKDKERLLSFAEPTRFIFSHSALREGWDNPNVFVICMLKHSDNTISRRQEVGRGLRISVDQLGERMDNPVTVHDINVLTVVASESYKDFVAGLQKEIVENLSARPRQANAEYFEGKLLNIDGDKLEITKEMAKKGQ